MRTPSIGGVQPRFQAPLQQHFSIFFYDLRTEWNLEILLDLDCCHLRDRVEGSNIGLNIIYLIITKYINFWIYCGRPCFLEKIENKTVRSKVRAWFTRYHNTVKPPLRGLQKLRNVC